MSTTDQSKDTAQGETEAQVPARPRRPAARRRGEQPAVSVTVEHDTTPLPDEHDREPEPAAEDGEQRTVNVRLRHRAGCPADPLRTESYPAQTPAQPDKGIPSRTVTIVRCCDCAEQIRVD